MKKVFIVSSLFFIVLSSFSMEAEKEETSRLIIRIKRRRKDPLLIARGYLTQAIIHKVIAGEKREVTPLVLGRGIWNFLIGEGEVDLNKKIELLEKSSSDYPVSHLFLCKLYLQKALTIISQEKKAGNSEAIRISRALEDYDIEELLECKADKKDKIPGGMFI